MQPAIVALKVTFVTAFEDEQAAVALGTGFVVDKERGLILTNRHITGVGPVRALAIFDRHEELEVQVVYRDPVHDFGFFRYDPKQLRYTELAAIQLDPEALRVGTEIRVVGNDAGEKLQILSGTIARVDRNVPEFNTVPRSWFNTSFPKKMYRKSHVLHENYEKIFGVFVFFELGSKVYNDENTFYAGAGAGTSGGSSGSPVLGRHGSAVALNAAGTDGAASAFFLPLDRVCYTLSCLRCNEAVRRGSCRATFLFKAFDELRKLGLKEADEVSVREKEREATGMLLVDSAA